MIVAEVMGSAFDCTGYSPALLISAAALISSLVSVSINGALIAVATLASVGAASSLIVDDEITKSEMKVKAKPAISVNVVFPADKVYLL
jgi:hypothetical protein